MTRPPTPVFISGMFRSGTTLLARMLDAHPSIACASDPFLPFFKTFRGVVARELLQDVPDALPFGDYYFDGGSQALFEKMRGASLDIEFSHDRLEPLCAEIADYTKRYSPLLIARLGETSGRTFTEVLQSLLGLVSRCYGSGAETVVAVKHVWMGECIPAIARGLPSARFIEIVRDPRAVCASKNVRRDKYPWLFMGRQWRKLAALTWAHSQSSESLEGRTLVVHYESLVADPTREAERIAGFLGLPDADLMVDPSRYRDGQGGAWSQNTAFGEGRAGFDVDAAERWRTVLKPDEIELIELLCGPEMEASGLQTDTRWWEPSNSLLLTPPRVDDNQIASWLKPLIANDPSSLGQELARETLRFRLLAASNSEVSATDSDLIRACFLIPELFEWLRGRRHRVDTGAAKKASVR